MKTCAACHEDLPKDKFSKKQWKLNQRRCKVCVIDNREVQQLPNADNNEEAHNNDDVVCSLLGSMKQWIYPTMCHYSRILIRLYCFVFYPGFSSSDKYGHTRVTTSISFESQEKDKPITILYQELHKEYTSHIH